MFSFATQPIWVNLLVFAAAVAAVWLIGGKLAVDVQLIADRTSLGRAFSGMVLLGVATSLPEIATTVTASVAGDPLLAGNNLLGGVSMQIAVLGFVDLVSFRHGPLTFFTPRPVLLMEGVLLIALLALAIAAMAAGEMITLGHVGLWSVGLAAAYVASLYTIRRYEQRPEWIAANKPAEHADTGASLTAAGNPPRSLRGLVLRFVVAALGVLIAGSLVARTGEAIALQSGLGSSFVGATLVAVSTSLPEVSTTFKAVRLGAYGMAVSNILGTNAVSVALLLVGDIAYRGGPILDALDRPALFLAALGVVTTAIYLWGLLERRDKTVLGMGVDSAAVLACYLAGIVVLYFIR